jgi:hypothetical protein
MKNQTLGIGASGSSGIVFVTTGVYDYEGLDSANPTSSLPSGFKIIGVGEKDNIILRSWNQVTIALTYGQATNVTIKNLTLSAFGPASAASAFAGGNNVFEDVVFIRQGQGTGLARVINAGEAGVGPGTTMIRCSSNDEMFDSSLSDQGNAKDGTFIDCTFTNGFPPKVAGSTFLNCNITTDRMNFFPATDPAAPVPGLIEGSTITRRTGSAEFLYLKHGTTIRNSSINVFNIKVEQSIAVDATIINTTISTAAGNTYSILKNDPVGTAPTVARYNVASNKPVDTVSTPLLILSNAFSNII